jgi:DNA-binding LacI/PurR family transcriptional regulator
LVYSFDKATLNAVNYLTQCGCNKIALAGDALKDRFNGNSLEGYINGIKTIPGMPRDGFVVDKASETSDDFLSAFARLHQKTNFDGLVFDVNFPINYSISLNRNLAIPESVKIITLHDFGYNRKLRPQVSASVFSFRQFGYDAVMALADDNSPPIKKFYDALIVERESTTANKLIQAFSNSTNGIKENSEQFSYN